MNFRPKSIGWVCGLVCLGTLIPEASAADPVKKAAEGTKEVKAKTKRPH